MANRFTGRLSTFVGDGLDEDTLSNPLADSTEEHTSSIRTLKSMRTEEADDDHAPQKKKKKKSFTEKILEYDREISEINGENGYEVFDSYFENYADSDEDVGLRNSLISQGRKYARETKVSAETSEVIRAFSGSEKNLQKLLDDVTTDIEYIQKDIDNMRAMRTGRNNKLLADMQMNKKEYYNVKLATIKEMNSIKKNQFDLQAKINKDRQQQQQDGGDGDALINRAIGSLFSGGGRAAALGTVGGYGMVSGALGADEDAMDTSDLNTEETSSVEIHDDGKMEGETAYLKYESVGAHLVVTEHADHTYTVSAEDRDGNVLPDYPLPTNANHLSFDVNERFGTARDDYHRKYEYRKDY